MNLVESVGRHKTRPRRECLNGGLKPGSAIKQGGMSAVIRQRIKPHRTDIRQIRIIL
ncbi:Uncharacterised protein [Yersinia frederiksenii]|nr:Uncharacterised protein [Yersinia frederiksenii]CNF68659.1 Uncharacterised protein [Yersinia frederiksenii]CNK76935.1 Uncharacterised protein [Yersinia frederiksenii]CQH17823.1 Uncharacterised protein [Yersinia frederiksenii]CQI96760.1 Uncharacterised protein [Yersinia frederiksenii]